MGLNLSSWSGGPNPHPRSLHFTKVFRDTGGILLPSIRERDYPFTGSLIFVHDRCPIHTARIVRQWFAEHPNLELLDWPSKGCDMNPIENIWANMVNLWEPARERTAEQLMGHTREQWELFRGNPRLVYNHVENMDKRLRAVIDQDGGWSGY